MLRVSLSDYTTLGKLSSAQNPYRYIRNTQTTLCVNHSCPDPAGAYNVLPASGPVE